MNLRKTTNNTLIVNGCIAGCLLGVLGSILGAMPTVLHWEETAGLDMLFRLRGPRPAPEDVVVIALDKLTADHLNLPVELNKWPRTVHAKLVDRVSRAGAAVIAYDVVFQDPSIKDDLIFARAITQAGNIVLAEYLHKMMMPLLPGDSLRSESKIVMEQFVRPVPLLSEAAAATAPFPLPKVPVRVSQYWTFKQTPSLTPTLPVMAFQIFNSDTYLNFCRVLTATETGTPIPICDDDVTPPDVRTLKSLAVITWRYFASDPKLAESMLATMNDNQLLTLSTTQRSQLHALIRSFQDPASRYLNFYGPPATIETISACKILNPSEKGVCMETTVDLDGKAVFIGLSERHRLDQKDGFHTVFSRNDGFDISGVELAATAFANLVEDNAVHPLKPFPQHALHFFFGMVLGIACIYYTPAPAAIAAVCISLLYLTGARHQFSHQALWLPLIVPLLIQAPLAYSGALAWKLFRSRKKIRNIREVFQMYLPEKVVDQLINNVDHADLNTTLVHCACLFTDAEHFTQVSEKMPPQNLPQFMNRYFDTIFAPIKKSGGTVSDVAGDGMLAFWAAANPGEIPMTSACLAALDIHRAVNQYNGQAEPFRLPTRLGLHAGPISLGNIGTADHFEYHPAGDTVNTASRIENLNKRMGTRILISGQVLNAVTGFMTRKLGDFIFAGKSEVITIYELMGLEIQATTQQKQLCRHFEQGLTAFCIKDWDTAVAAFAAAISIEKNDGPARYYLERCEAYRNCPPVEWHDGVVML